MQKPVLLTYQDEREINAVMRKILSQVDFAAHVLTSVNFGQ
jgi:hypothetical protein